MAKGPVSRKTAKRLSRDVEFQNTSSRTRLAKDYRPFNLCGFRLYDIYEGKTTSDLAAAFRAMADPSPSNQFGLHLRHAEDASSGISEGTQSFNFGLLTQKVGKGSIPLHGTAADLPTSFEGVSVTVYDYGDGNVMAEFAFILGEELVISTQDEFVHSHDVEPKEVIETRGGFGAQYGPVTVGFGTLADLEHEARTWVSRYISGLYINKDYLGFASPSCPTYMLEKLEETAQSFDDHGEVLDFLGVDRLQPIFKATRLYCFESRHRLRGARGLSAGWVMVHFGDAQIGEEGPPDRWGAMMRPAFSVHMLAGTIYHTYHAGFYRYLKAPDYRAAFKDERERLRASAKGLIDVPVLRGPRLGRMQDSYAKVTATLGAVKADRAKLRRTARVRRWEWIAAELQGLVSLPWNTTGRPTNAVDLAAVMPRYLKERQESVIATYDELASTIEDEASFGASLLTSISTVSNWWLQALGWLVAFATLLVTLLIQK